MRYIIEIENTQIYEDIESIINQLSNETNLLKDQKISGDNLMVTCPMHGGGNEKRPSCGISLSDVKRQGNVYKAGTVHCFTCGYSADLPNLVSDCFGKEDKGVYGFQWLIDNFLQIEITQRRSINLFKEKPKEKEQVIVQKEDLDKYYEYQNDYLKTRGIEQKTEDFFEVGFDIEHDALVFPIYNTNSDIIGVAKRPVKKAANRYINENFEKSSTLYGIDKIIQNINRINEVWIVEGFIDCLTLWQFGIPTVALMGALITKAQVEILKDLPIRKYIIMLDNPEIDEAGKVGLKRIKKMLTGKMLYKFNYPSDMYKDPNDFIHDKWLFDKAKENLSLNI